MTCEHLKVQYVRMLYQNIQKPLVYAVLYISFNCVLILS